MNENALSGTLSPSRFYILISGAISFHVNSTDDLETMVQKQKEEEATAREQGRPVNREVYGTQVGTGCTYHYLEHKQKEATHLISFALSILIFSSQVLAPNHDSHILHSSQ